mgnify:FL=1
MNETPYPTITRFPIPPRSTAEKLKSHIHQVIDFGTTQEDQKISHVLEQLTQKPLPKGKLLQSSLRFVLSHFPQKFRDKHFNNYFANAPIPDDNTQLEVIGEGGVNKVFAISLDSQSPSIAIGISKKDFESKDEAFTFAEHQQQEHDLIASFFQHIPNVIPDEQYAIFQGPRQKYNVMHFQNFVEGPIRDFFDMPAQELQALIQSNPQFNDQLKKFAQTCHEHSDFFIQSQIDFLGPKNLAIIGKEGREQLLFLDPHFRLSDHTPDKEQEISNRIDYLSTVANL